MSALLRPSLTLFGLLSALTGLLYPATVTALAQIGFPDQANGSLIIAAGAVRGSRLIGQPFDDPGYFWSRPSATNPEYNGAASSGSNLGPNNPALAAAVEARRSALVNAGGVGPVPADLLASSGSGLDPHISPEAAAWQAPRVAAARGLAQDQVRALVESHTIPRAFGLIGEPVVHVLELNLALAGLDSAAPTENP